MVSTSRAAPHVSGVIALLRAVNSSLTVSQLTSILTSTAEPLANSCGSSAVGAGIVDAAAAVAKAASTTSTRTTASSFSLGTPSISGPVKVGSKLTVSASTTPTASSIGYQWMVNGTTVSTSSTYTPTAANYGKTLTVKAKAGCASASRTKTSTAKTIAAGTFTKTVSPKASGTFKVGKTVKATKGTWSPTPTSYSYRWYRSGKKITGATKASYKLKKADKGKKISVRVTVKRGGYTTAAASSSSHKVH